MNKEEFIKEIKKLGIIYNDEMLRKLEIYKEFLKEYNSHTNLTAIKNDEDIYLKHFYDSLTIIKGIDLTLVNNLLDVGTGAGFPGMVIKIFYPHIDVYLLDSNNKKIKFLNELQEKIDVKVHIINDRIENYAKENLNKFDIVTSRAVANMRVLGELAMPLVKKNGFFVALKGNITLEMEEAKDTIFLLNGKVNNIVTIEKLEETKKEILRQYDKIIKKPLKKNGK